MTPLARTLEALLFLSPDPVSIKDLADATGAWDDEVTEAVTLFALLELYRKGEADWEQDGPFAPITIRATA